MVAFSTLKSRFQDWLGLVDVPTTAGDRLEEILNASVALTLTDGVPGRREVWLGFTRPDLTVTVGSHSAGSAVVTLTEALDDVFPTDIYDAPDGNSYLIREVDRVARTVDVGNPVQASLSGSGSIRRRCLEMPHAGRVLAVAKEGFWENPLPYSPLATVLGSLGNGEPNTYTVGWAANVAKPFLSFSPPPSSTSSFLVVQALSLDDDADYDVPDAQVYPIMLKALVLWRTVTDEQSPVVAGLTQGSERDSRSIRTSTPGSAAVHVK